MVVSTGSFLRHLGCKSGVGWTVAWLAAALLTARAGAALPDYARQALDRFSTRTPAGWAYTVTTTRDEQRMVERFDPVRPPGEQWSLLELDGRAPDPDELENYRRSRPDAAAGGPQPIFQKEDIEPGSLELVRDGAAHAEFRGAFREVAATRDRTLSYLVIHLVIRKERPFVAKYRLELREPFSPVLTVKIKSLAVEATYLAPEGDRPSLPASLTSDFAGTMLLLPKREKLHVRFSDFVQVR